MPALGPALMVGCPGVETVVRMQRAPGASISYEGDEFTVRNLVFIDSTVFKAFSFELIIGDKHTTLCRPYSCVITESLATKFFGTENPLGKTLLYDGEQPLEVTGVIRDIPSNTIMRCEFMVAYSSLNQMGMEPDMPWWNQWGSVHTFVLLKKKASIQTIVDRAHELLASNTSEWFTSMVSFRPLRFSDIYLNSKARAEMGPTGNRLLTQLLAVVAGLILVLACMNYINLAMARSMKRLKDLGTRKLLGASLRSLMTQLLSESFILALIAALMGLALFEILEPRLCAFVGTTMDQNASVQSLPVILSAVLVVVVGLLAGAYPAILLARRGSVLFNRYTGQASLLRKSSRRTLVVVQFAISIALIIATLTVFRQVHYMRNSDLGFDKDNVVLLSWGLNTDAETYTTLKSSLLQIPEVECLSGAYTLPGVNSWQRMSVSIPTASADDNHTIRATAVDQDYCHVLGLDVLAGRDLSDIPFSATAMSVLLNETAVSHLGLKQPVGTQMIIPRGDTEREVTVVGVVDDFHLGSFEQAIQPLLLYVDTKALTHVAIRINTGDFSRTLSRIESAWQEALPDSPFYWYMLDDAYDAMYGSDEQMGELMTLSAGLATLICCLGLFGLAAFSAERRTKEIGIRKVLGASIVGIVQLLSKEFIVLIVFANVIAWPVAYYVMNRWLENFAYRVAIGWETFLAAGTLALVIALVTVSFQAIKAALANPVEALKCE